MSSEVEEASKGDDNIKNQLTHLILEQLIQTLFECLMRLRNSRNFPAAPFDLIFLNGNYTTIDLGFTGAKESHEILHLPCITVSHPVLRHQKKMTHFLIGNCFVCGSDGRSDAMMMSSGDEVNSLTATMKVNYFFTRQLS